MSAHDAPWCRPAHSPLSLRVRKGARAVPGPRSSLPPLSPDPRQNRPPWNAGPSLVPSVRAQSSTAHPHAVRPVRMLVTLPRCPSGGTSVDRMTPLVHFLGAWLELPGLSRWVIRTIRFGYAIQFARSPPRFRGVRSTLVGGNAPVMRAEIAALLAKGAIETVPPAEMRSGFYCPYFIVPRKTGGLRPILDLRILGCTLHRVPFKMLTAERIFECVRPQDWFAAIDLKDAYFHVSILPRHRPFLRFAFEGRAYQYAVLPFGLALSPRVFTKIAEAALVPLREHGVRILNYLDDWLILAHSRDRLRTQRPGAPAPSPFGPSGQPGEEQLCPVQRISFLGMEIDSVAMSAQLTSERAHSLLACLRQFEGKSAVPLKLSEAPGAYGIRSRGNAARTASYETASAVASRSSPEVGMASRRAPSSSDSSVPPNLSPWSNLSFLRAGSRSSEFPGIS